MRTDSLFKRLEGIVSNDAYNTAWIGLVPDKNNLQQPQWPEALAALRVMQLPDGGWGAPKVYHPHERTLCTLAAVCALSTWQEQPSDAQRIEQGIEALHLYAHELPQLPFELVGYELTLPRLVQLLSRFNLKLPQTSWNHILKVGELKQNLIGSLEIEPGKPRTWWFNIEMLPAERLTQLNDAILNHHGSIVTAVAPTAAYLRAQRLHGKDSPRAANYIARVLGIGQGGASFAWPVEHFEQLWMLDQFKRVGFPAEHPVIWAAVHRLLKSWLLPPKGFSSSAAFPVADGDDTSVAYDLFRWVGLTPSPEPLLAFWDTNHFRTYRKERTASVTVNLHMLSALRYPHQNMFTELAALVIEWLRPQLHESYNFADKWHFSPIYVASHAVEIMIDWDKPLAKKSLDFLLSQQQSDGGWGCCGHSTIEETNHAIIGLLAAYQRGLVKNKRPLQFAAHFLYQNRRKHANERLWIGKTLFHSSKISAALETAVSYGLHQAKIDVRPFTSGLTPVHAAHHQAY